MSNHFFLLESGDQILLEDGDVLLLESLESLESQDLTGDDVIWEIILANDRKQGGVTVTSNGHTFQHKNNNTEIDDQVLIDRFKNRLNNTSYYDKEK